MLQSSFRTERSSVSTVAIDQAPQTPSFSHQAAQVSLAQLADILSHHYGDGYVYVPSGCSLDDYAEARALGYLNEEGYLTPKGRELLLSLK